MESWGGEDPFSERVQIVRATAASLPPAHHSSTLSHAWSCWCLPYIPDEEPAARDMGTAPELLKLSNEKIHFYRDQTTLLQI